MPRTPSRSEIPSELRSALSALKGGQAKLWILLVSVHHYDDPRLPSLPYAAIDCQSLAYALTQATRSFPERTIAIHHDLASRAPTLSAVRESLQEIAEYAQPQDTVLFYFCGHGALEPRLQQAVFCLADTQKDALLKTGLSAIALLGALGNCKAKQQVVWLDTCHSDNVRHDGSNHQTLDRLDDATAQLIEILRRRAAQHPGFDALLSCDNSQQSWKFPELGHGVFTHYLVQGLQGEAANAQGIIDTDGLCDYVYSHTLQYVNQRNQKIRFANQHKQDWQEQQLEYTLQKPKRVVRSSEKTILGVALAERSAPTAEGESNATSNNQSKLTIQDSIKPFQPEIVETLLPQSLIQAIAAPVVQEPSAPVSDRFTPSSRDPIDSPLEQRQREEAERHLQLQKAAEEQRQQKQKEAERLQLEQQRQREEAEQKLQLQRTAEEQRQREEAERLQLEQQRQREQEEAEQKLQLQRAAEEQRQREREEAERLRLEQQRQREEAERQRLQLEQQRQREQEEAERLRFEQQQREEAERLRFEQQQREEAERQLQFQKAAEQQRLREQEEAERQRLQLEQQRQREEAEQKLQLQRAAEEQRQREEAEPLQLEQQRQREEAERLRLQKAAEEQRQREQEEAKRLHLEQQRLREEAERKLQLQKAAEEQRQREEIERLQLEQRQREETERLQLQKAAEEQRQREETERHLQLQKAIEQQRQREESERLHLEQRQREQEEAERHQEAAKEQRQRQRTQKAFNIKNDLKRFVSDTSQHSATAVGGLKQSAERFTHRFTEQQYSPQARKIIVFALAGFGLLACGMAASSFYQQRNAQLRDIRALSVTSEKLSSANQSQAALVVALQIGHRLQQLDRPWNFLPESAKISAIATLQQAILRSQTPPQLGQPTVAIAYSSDRQRIATASPKGAIVLWNKGNDGNWKSTTTLSGHSAMVTQLQISPDGNLLASASADKTIKLWNIEKGILVKTLPRHSDRVTAIRFRSDGGVLASGSADQTVKLWTIPKGDLVETLKAGEATISAIDFSTDGRILATGSSDNTLRLWYPESNQPILLGHHNESPAPTKFQGITDVRFSPDGKAIASAGGDKTIKLWTVSDGKPERAASPYLTLTGHSQPASSISFNADGQILASGSQDKTIKLWNLRSGAVIKTLFGHQDPVESLSFDANGSALTSASDRNGLIVWDLNLTNLMKQGCNHLRQSPQDISESNLPSQTIREIDRTCSE
ncbi:MAG: caspase family protein [Myxacorys californica WJT36-NPBG1]|nr:caspase family protein [Myxacorys californica WJT36-NPBG1]